MNKKLSTSKKDESEEPLIDKSGEGLKKLLLNKSSEQKSLELSTCYKPSRSKTLSERGVPVSPFPRKMIGIWISRFTMGPWIHDRFLDSRWVLHPQEGGRLDAKSPSGCAPQGGWSISAEPQAPAN